MKKMPTLRGWVALIAAALSPRFKRQLARALDIEEAWLVLESVADPADIDALSKEVHRRFMLLASDPAERQPMAAAIRSVTRDVAAGSEWEAQP